MRLAALGPFASRTIIHHVTRPGSSSTSRAAQRSSRSHPDILGRRVRRASVFGSQQEHGILIVHARLRRVLDFSENGRVGFGVSELTP